MKIRFLLAGLAVILFPTLSSATLETAPAPPNLAARSHGHLAIEKAAPNMTPAPKIRFACTPVGSPCSRDNCCGVSVCEKGKCI